MVGAAVGAWHAVARQGLGKMKPRKPRDGRRSPALGDMGVVDWPSWIELLMVEFSASVRLFKIHGRWMVYLVVLFKVWSIMRQL